MERRKPLRQLNYHADKGGMPFLRKLKKREFAAAHGGFTAARTCAVRYLRMNSSMERMSSAAMVIFDFSIRRLRPVMM